MRFAQHHAGDTFHTIHDTSCICFTHNVICARCKKNLASTTHPLLTFSQKHNITPSRTHSSIHISRTKIPVPSVQLHLCERVEGVLLLNPSSFRVSGVQKSTSPPLCLCPFCAAVVSVHKNTGTVAYKIISPSQPNWCASTPLPPHQPSLPTAKGQEMTQENTKKKRQLLLPLNHSDDHEQPPPTHINQLQKRQHNNNIKIFADDPPPHPQV